MAGAICSPSAAARLGRRSRGARPLPAAACSFFRRCGPPLCPLSPSSPPPSTRATRALLCIYRAGGSPRRGAGPGRRPPQRDGLPRPLAAGLCVAPPPPPPPPARPGHAPAPRTPTARFTDGPLLPVSQYCYFKLCFLLLLTLRPPLGCGRRAPATAARRSACAPAACFTPAPRVAFDRTWRFPPRCPLAFEDRNHRPD
ncbi:MAG: hypothetical protein J3K34DRAFT_115269 [Monoraphidium minutum]|nr:MAG: hypothetical protein J3K34DRAFT_115269 [Monoraphidium minutum]